MTRQRTLIMAILVVTAACITIRSKIAHSDNDIAQSKSVSKSNDKLSAKPATEQKDNGDADANEKTNKPNKPTPQKTSNDMLKEIAEQWQQMLPIDRLRIPGSSDPAAGIDDRPVLPLTGSDPFPFEASGDISKLLDQRTAKQRFFGERPANVDPDGTITGVPDKKSFVGHPGVQPRPHRSQHYRLNVDNIDQVPIPRLVCQKADGSEKALSQAAVERARKQAILFPDSGAIEPRFLPQIHARDKLFVTYVQTAPGMFPSVDPFLHPPGTNMLPTVYQNMRDRYNNVMPNTLPSHPNNPYNLHDGEPVVTQLPTLSSPTDDLRYVIDETFELITDVPRRRLWERLATDSFEDVLKNASHADRIVRNRDRLLRYAQWAIDIIEGNAGDNSKVPSNRAYRGFPLLHHSGHKRNNRVQPVFNDKGEVVGGNVNIHQIWYGGRIESDTMFFDFGWDDDRVEEEHANGKTQVQWYAKNGGTKEERKRPAPIPPDVPWTATYTIDVLNRGEDDFSPTQIYFDDLENSDDTPHEVPTGRILDPKTGKSKLTRFGPPHVAMDQTFFPMQEGTRTVLKIKMAPPKYTNVTYTWGWRMHPPRAQAVENSHKRIPPSGEELVGHYQVVKNHISWPDGNPEGEKKLPPFDRLRIVDHERFTFDGLKNVEDEVATYKDDSNDNLTEEKLREKFNLLEKNVPFFKPIISDPNDPAFDIEKGPISRIGDLAPAKRMWRAFRSIRQQLADEKADFTECLLALIAANDAFLDWQDRNHLPSGLLPDPCSDFTLLYVNNTLYGESRHGGLKFDEWKTRGDPTDPKKQPNDLQLTIINADYFLHGYINPDFGGSRGWENQFKPTLALGGSGSFFTFGRFHWRFNTEPGVVGIPPAVMLMEVNDDGKFIDSNGNILGDATHADQGEECHQSIVKCRKFQDYVHPGKETLLSPCGEPIYDGKMPAGVRPFLHRVWIRYNFEPSRRLRFYQFDPLHHDVNIYSIH